MKSIKVTVVIPVFNEEKSLVELHEKILKALKSYKVNCIYVDDASTDDSFKILKEIKKRSKESKVTILKFRKHLGKSPALAVGFKYAKGDIVVTIDADLQDDPNEIPKLIRKMSEGYQLVSGWRTDRHDNWQKTLPSKVFNKLVGTISGVKLNDFNTGLKAYKNSVIKEISLYGELHRYVPLLAVNRGFKVAEVPVKHHKRKYGKSKYGIRRIFQAGFDFLSTLFLTYFKERPMQLFGSIGSVAIAVSLIILSYLAFLRLEGHAIGTRPLLLFGILLLLFGVQLVLTGFLAELITSYNQTRESYPIEEIVE